MGSLSNEEQRVLAGLLAGDPEAVDGLAALDVAAQQRVVARLGELQGQATDSLTQSEPPELEGGQDDVGGVETLNQEELEVLESLRSAEPDAADRLGALDGVSQARVIANLHQPPATREDVGQSVVDRQPSGTEQVVGSQVVAEQSPGEPDEPLLQELSVEERVAHEPVASARASKGWILLALGILLIAAGVIVVGGYGLYNRILDDNVTDGQDTAEVSSDPGNGQAPRGPSDDNVGLLPRDDEQLLKDVTEDFLKPEPKAEYDLLLSRDDNLFLDQTLAEIDRDDPIVRNYLKLLPTRVARDGDWWQMPVASEGNRRLLLAETQGGAEAWVIDGADRERFSHGNNSMTSLLIGDTLYIQESRDGTQECFRGSIKSADVLELLSQGDFCSIAYSGHTLQVHGSPGSYRATVFSPEGTETEVRRANFQSLPVLSENGLILVSRDDEGVAAVDAKTGDRVYDNEGGVDFDMISHPSGRAALAVTISTGEVFLVMLYDQGSEDIAEIEIGRLTAVFSTSGDLFWTVRADNGDTILYVWDASANNVVELTEEIGLEIADVYEDSVVTVTEDDIGTYFQRFSASSREGIELHELDDTVDEAVIIGDHFLITGSEIASVVPLDGGEPSNSNTWDRIKVFDVDNDGVLVAAGVDGSSEVLFSIRPGANRDVEYGEYDSVVSAQIYGNTLYATVQDGSGVGTLTFDVSSGEPHDNAVDYEGYQLINNRIGRYRDIISANAEPPPTTTTTTTTTLPPTTTTTLPPTTTSSPDRPLEGAYVSILISVGSEAEVQSALTRFERQYEREFGILYSSDYASLRSGWWVVYAGPFATAEESQSTCWTELDRRSANQCYGRRLSQDIADRDIVYPPAPG